MRIVFDSSVLVAAFATHGVCHELFEYSLRNSTILISDFILEEVERTLIQKIKVPAKKTSEIIRYLKDQSQMVVPEKCSIEKLRDPNDIMIVATALTGEAEYLITGDKDLLVLKKVKKTVIMAPRDFWILCQSV